VGQRWKDPFRLNLETTLRKNKKKSRGINVVGKAPRTLIPLSSAECTGRTAGRGAASALEKTWEVGCPTETFNSKHNAFESPEIK